MTETGTSQGDDLHITNFALDLSKRMLTLDRSCLAYADLADWLRAMQQIDQWISSYPDDPWDADFTVAYESAERAAGDVGVGMRIAQRLDAARPATSQTNVLHGARVVREIARYYKVQGVTGIRCPELMPAIAGKTYDCGSDENISFHVKIVSSHRYTWQAVAGLGAGGAFPLHTDTIP